jgi:hypothetical protein
VVVNPVDIAESVVASGVGSLAALAIWFHWDVEDHWRLWKVRRGRRMEERARRRDDTAQARHRELLEEERRREEDREWPR